MFPRTPCVAPAGAPILLLLLILLSSTLSRAGPAGMAATTSVGESIYRRGIAGSGAPLTASRGPDLPLSGRAAACINCHQRSGLGAKAGNRFIPPVAGDYLFRARRPGVDRTMLALRAEGKTAGNASRCEVFGVPLGEAAKLELAKVAATLRAAGVRVDLAYGDRGMKGAMRAADRSGARIALVAGDRDIEAGTIGVKNLSTGEQIDVPANAVVDEVVSKLA